MNTQSINGAGVDFYLEEINHYPILTRRQEVALAERYRRGGDLTAAYRLIVSNLRSVVKIAREYDSYGRSLPDVIREGNIGLMLAVRSFDAGRGLRLTSYARGWIRASIRSSLLDSWPLAELGTRARRSRRPASTG